MEWRHEHATLIPAGHAVPGLSQIGLVVYDDGLFGDALIAQCAADLVHTKSSRLSNFHRGSSHTPKARRRGNYGLVPECQPRLSSVQA